MYILRITIKSSKKINNFNQTLLTFIKKHKFNFIKLINCVQVKKKKKNFTVLKSPHVNKKSREHFIYNNYLQKFDIYFLNFYCLLNFLFFIKTFFNKNSIIKTKIIKKLCL